MKRSIGVWQWAGFGTVSLLGTLLHFLYEWSGSKPWAAVVSGVNESTWEHMKLLFVPWLLFSLVQYAYFKRDDRFWRAKAVGITCGLLCIPTLFYTYNGMFGKSPDWLNISIFFVAAAWMFWVEYRCFARWKIHSIGQRWFFSYILLLAVLFFVFTFKPPQLPLFQDPVTGQFGL